MNGLIEIITEISIRKGIFAIIAQDLIENYHEKEAIKLIWVVGMQYEDDPKVGNQILGENLYHQIFKFNNSRNSYRTLNA